MIRTHTVELSVLTAIAYRQKLTAGGSSIVILKKGAKQPGIATISKTSGEAILATNTQVDLYPIEAFQEAIELTAGMPYHRLGKPRTAETRTTGKPAEPNDDPVIEEAAEAEVIVDSGEYQKLVDTYTDKKGKLSYDLLNRDLIKFVHSSEVARSMIAAGESEEAIRLYAVGTKFRTITGNKDLTDEQVLKMAALLDEVSPRGVFKELNSEIRARLGASKTASSPRI